MPTDDSDSSDVTDLPEDPREPQGPMGPLPSQQLERGRKDPRRKRRRSPSRQGVLNTVAEPTGQGAVYSNLLILEDSLRVQLMSLRRRRRRGLIFFWTTAGAGVALAAKQARDPSPYPWIRVVERLLMIAAFITLGLFFLTGLARTVFVVAPRFIADSNRGLKDLNLRLVYERASLRETVIRLLVNPAYVDHPGRLVKLVLSPRHFSPHYIEEWEVYRDEFWAREDRRRKRRKLQSKPSSTSSRDLGTISSGLRRRNWLSS